MIDIIYFSPCGSTKVVATAVNNVFSNRYKCNVIDCTHDCVKTTTSDKVVIIMPVYNNALPVVVSNRLSAVASNYKHAMVVLTYGGVVAKGALYHCKLLLPNATIHGVLIVKTPHCYITNKPMVISEKLLSVIEKFAELSAPNLNEGKGIKVAKAKTSSSKAFEWLMSKALPTPLTTSKCSGCNLCLSVCPTAVINGALPTGHDCINCNACVNICPQKARKSRHWWLVKFFISVANLFTLKHRIKVK